MTNIYKEIQNDPRNVEHTKVGEEMLTFLQKFNQIEEKSKCLRVQFLDWLSDKLLDWSNRVHVVSVNINSPCVIKVEPRKKEESKSAKENKEIARLKELLAKQNDRVTTLTEENDKMAKEVINHLEKKVAEMTK